LMHSRDDLHVFNIPNLRVKVNLPWYENSLSVDRLIKIRYKRGDFYNRGQAKLLAPIERVDSGLPGFMVTKQGKPTAFAISEGEYYVQKSEAG